jgi:outer membrane lipoprotein-sorting protein
LLLCASVVALGVTATAAASAIDGGPAPPDESLPVAAHDALAAKPVEGVSASIQYTNHLVEGAGLAAGEGGGELASSPLLTGATGRLWISQDGKVRLELQSEKGDTEVVYYKHALTAYVPSSNTLYRFSPPQHESADSSTGSAPEARKVPSVGEIEEAISRLERHVDISGPHPTNIAGQPAYTTRISPKQGGSLLGGLELSWDANHGVPLRAAVYSSTGSSPVIELAATEITYGPLDGSVFELDTPANAKVVEPAKHTSDTSAANGASPASGVSGSAGAPSGEAGEPSGHHPQPKERTIGHGITSVLVLESPAQEGGAKSSSVPQGLQKVEINGASASELQTALGTILMFERGGVGYVVAGALKPQSVEAVARGL